LNVPPDLVDDEGASALLDVLGDDDERLAPCMTFSRMAAGP